MNLFNRSDLSNRPVLKYTIFALVAVNAFALALLLSGPGRGSSAGASALSGDIVGTAEENSSGDGDKANTADKASEDSDEANTTDNASEENTEEDVGGSDEEGEMPASGPLLELTDDHVTLKVGDPFNFYDYLKTTVDRDGSSLSRYIVLRGSVNTYEPGEYTITYRITSRIDGETASRDLKVTVE